MTKFPWRLRFPQKSRSELGATYIEIVIVLVPCLVAMGLFFATGMLAAFMGEAQTIVVIDTEMIKAADGLSNKKYAKFDPGALDNFTVGHLSPTSKGQALANLKDNLNPNNSEHVALANFYAGARAGRYAIGFAEDKGYLQATVGMQKIGKVGEEATRLVWNAIRFWNPLGALPGMEDYLVVSAGSLRLANSDLNLGQIYSSQIAPAPAQMTMLPSMNGSSGGGPSLGGGSLGGGTTGGGSSGGGTSTGSGPVGGGSVGGTG